jgi:hypothetical protein
MDAGGLHDDMQVRSVEVAYIYICISMTSWTNDNERDDSRPKCEISRLGNIENRIEQSRPQADGQN